MINPQSLNLSALPSLPLDRRSQLPEIPCIYFAVDSQGTVQYIGRTVNAKQRWLNHHRCDQLSSMDGVTIAYLEVSDESLLESIEEALIEYFQPRLNYSFLPRKQKASTDGNAVRWHLKEVMARHDIKGKDLAIAMQVSPNSVTSLRSSKTMPRIDGETLGNLCMELRKLSGDETITPATLISFLPDKED